MVISQAADTEPEPVIYYDATPLFTLDLKDPAQRRRFWDESQLLSALQGLANRAAPRLFVRYVEEPDDFWWQQMTAPGGWLAGRKVHRIAALPDLLRHFRTNYLGAVVWDERVPSTSNLASTIAGCENLLPLRHDLADGSLFRQLTTGDGALEPRVTLLASDGGPLFSASGRVPGTDLPSTGSAKCDAYTWLIEHYVKTGKASPRRMGYFLDAFWLRCWNASAPVNATLSNHDFVIAQRGVLFDLGVWDDESPVDDPAQPPGTDAATLKRLFRAAWERFGGDGMIHVAGFVPWAFKYTTFKSSEWSAGGHHAEVPTEWRYAEILSCFNAFMDADALGLGAMANASFFQHFPLKPRYPQSPKPTRESLIARGVLDAEGRIPRRAFVAHYVGDYDSAAWLYQQLPRMWRDPARGRVPLSWAFNPNLAERFPPGMAWAREHATTNDWFVAGDSGAGYLNPGYLTPPRPHSGLPSGLAAWERHCREFYQRWDLSLTGFVIDGYARGLSPEGLDAYARFSPDGIVAQKVPLQGVHGDMPFLRMATDLPADATEAAKVIRSLGAGTKPRFAVCRSILQTPSWYAQVSEQLRKLAGDDVQVVDLYTLLWLVREFETNRAAYVTRRSVIGEVAAATPDAAAGLSVLHLEDGPIELVEHEGAPCWELGGRRESRYLYVDLDDNFRGGSDRDFRVELEFLDAGSGSVVLEYDSSDAAAPLGGAYKRHAVAFERGVSGRWRKVSWRLPDARLGGSQNGGADFRIVAGGAPLLIRRIEVTRGR